MSEEEEDDILAAARQRTDAALDALAEIVALRHKSAVLDGQHSVEHERWLANTTLHRVQDRIAHLKQVIEIKDATIASLESTADGWREIAARRGDPPETDRVLRVNRLSKMNWYGASSSMGTPKRRKRNS
jgi:hypothetical protein